MFFKSFVIKNIYKSFHILDAKEKINFRYLFLAMIFATFVEMVGISSIPIFIIMLLSPELIYEKLSFLNEFILFENINNQNIVLIGAILIIVIFLIKNSYLALYYYFSGLYFRNINIRLSKTVFEHYLQSNYSFHLNKNPNELLRNTINECNKVVSLISEVFQLFLEGMILIIIFILLLNINFFLSLTVFSIFLLITFLFYTFFKNILKKLGKLIQVNTHEQLKIVSQVFNAIKEIKIYNREPEMLDIFSTNLNEIRNNTFKVSIINKSPKLFLEFISASIVSLVAIYFVLQGETSETIIPILSFLAVASIRMIPAFYAVSRALNTIRYCEPALHLIDDELKKDIIKINSIKNETLSFDSKISFKNLSFNYEGSKLKILNQINLIINKGDKIGLLGKSGSGKTTFVNILSGLLQPTEGSIEIDNKSLPSNLLSYPKSIGYIPQDVYLFDDTVRNNITLNQKNSDILNEKLNYAINKSQIKEFLSSLEYGVDTIIGNKGIKISGGQRQRIGIARALYNDAQIIILDEATNALDDANESSIITEILENLTNKTIVVISHNLKTLQKCERILRIENGEIYEKN
jgi:ABC-type bacteriocin/lantibiotic exporter with double-glycine peptidase domain